MHHCVAAGVMCRPYIALLATTATLALLRDHGQYVRGVDTVYDWNAAKVSMLAGPGCVSEERPHEDGCNLLICRRALSCTWQEVGEQLRVCTCALLSSVLYA